MAQFTYNGDNQGISLTIDGIANSDLLTIRSYLTVISTSQFSFATESDKVVINFYSKNAGTYNIQVGKLSTLKNYLFETQTASYVIQPKVLIGNWSTSTGNIEDIYSGEFFMVSLTISGFVDDKDYTISDFISSNDIDSISSLNSDETINFSVNEVGMYNFEVFDINDSNYDFGYSTFEYLILAN